MKDKFPLRFFVMTFLWSWFLWLPFVLAGLGICHMDASISPIITEAVIILGAFGPAVGAFYSIRTLEGKGEFKNFIKTFLSFRLGWKAWAGIFFVIVIIMVAWYIPELFGAERLPMLLPDVITQYIFISDLLVGNGISRGRARRNRLAWLYIAFS